MPLIYKREQQPVRRLTEVQPLQQSKLNLAYRLPIYYREQGFYDAIVFNGLFGGTPISMLFKNVREKNSLAYYASSRFDGFTGTLLVQTGIDQRNQAAVEEIIAAQLQAISQGEFSDELFNQVVASLINGRESRQDSQRALVNQAMLNQLVRKKRECCRMGSCYSTRHTKRRCASCPAG
ncbi:insulinase family protein [Secundilactobacillus odoratitofui]|uniref:insulinase family protein n=1 Tax=Secundilactobacillus odoratitofui TaxID=480930 RepID=UPI000B0294F0|nr:insulinase family protein [Secundilactobacillus odoratitofui]